MSRHSGSAMKWRALADPGSRPTTRSGGNAAGQKRPKRGVDGDDEGAVSQLAQIGERRIE
ncbi:MAG: hypothetical protein QM736_29540 [Vicinamibacterales bacterium]